jgi:hypothetical protein
MRPALKRRKLKADPDFAGRLVAASVSEWQSSFQSLTLAATATFALLPIKKAV